MPSIFLSHNRKDKPFARKLVEPLVRHGIRVWIDDAEIKYGDSLIRKIHEGIQGVEYLGVILSPQSVKSNWVQQELEAALTMSISGQNMKVIPILYEDCDVPIFLQNLVYADFRNPNVFELNMERLIYSIIPSDTVSIIESIVKKSLAIEVLDEVFAEESPAKRRIVEIIKNHAIRNWVLTNDNNPSTNDLISIQFEKIVNDRAYVRTEEYWYLKWFDRNIQDYIYKYNNTNEQIYILSKVGNAYDNWKIETNFYPTESEDKNIVPKLPAVHSDINKRKHVDISVVHARVRELISQNGLQRAIEELNLYSTNSEVKKQLGILNAQFLSLVKEKNLNGITVSEYTRKVSAISYQLLGLIATNGR